MLSHWLEKASLNTVQTLGLYIHVPFCRRACHYCDFYFTPRASLMEAYTEALLHEIDLYGPLLEAFPIQTVFFGGGTPSWLPFHLWERVFRKLSRFSTYAPTEVTIEANPEDISLQSLHFWQAHGVTRISIGIQSFSPRVLRTLGRFHTPEAAYTAVELLSAASLSSWNADLIFGVPGQSMEEFLSDISFLAAHHIPHLSLYGLTIEERTVLYKKVQRGRFVPVDDELYDAFYHAAHGFLQEAGFIWYEISNWARPGHECKHNWRYWRREAYIGLGPSAHSFIPEVRWANKRSLRAYLASLETGEYPLDFWEALSAEEQQRELWITQFRTRLGISLSELRSEDRPALYESLEKMVASGWIEKEGDRYRLTAAGALIANRLALELDSQVRV
ncbi:MAG: radical SAM family heme chaperone HemW [Bacteroidia bacterium]|nr:radical SAM family heme chaperone HemW [Bacteroidia bacterium]